MDFLGVGVPEIIFVLIITILVLGPKDISKTARTIGRFLNRMYKSDEWRALTEASKTLRTLPNRLAREAELEDLKEVKDSIKGAAQDIDQVQRDLTKEVKSSVAGLQLSPEDKARAMKAWTTPSETSDSKVDTADVPETNESGTEMEES